MELEIIRQDENFTHLSLSGAFDIRGVEDVKKELLEWTVERGKPTIIDLSMVSLINSMGISLLVTTLRGMEAKQVPVVFYSPMPGVMEVFKMTRLNTYFTIVDTMGEALKRLGK